MKEKLICYKLNKELRVIDIVGLNNFNSNLVGLLLDPNPNTPRSN